MNLTEITEYSKTEAALTDLRQRYGNVVFDVATTEGKRQALEARAEVRGYRVDLEKRRKEIKEPALERCRLIDAEAKRITAELEAIEKPIDEAIKAEEARKAAEKAELAHIEAERVAAMRKAVQAIAQYPLQCIGETVDQLRQSLAIFRDFPANLGDDDFTRQAQDAKISALATIERMIAKAEEADAQRAKLEAERTEIAALKARAEQRAAEEAKRQAEEARKASAALVAEKARMKTERDAHELAMKTEREKAAAEKAEQDHFAADLEKQRREQEAIARGQAQRQAELTRAEHQSAIKDSLTPQTPEDLLDEQMLASAKIRAERTTEDFTVVEPSQLSTEELLNAAVNLIALIVEHGRYWHSINDMHGMLMAYYDEIGTPDKLRSLILDARSYYGD